MGGGLWFGVEVSRVEFFSCYFLSSSLYMMSLLLKLSSTYLVCNSGVCDFFFANLLKLSVCNHNLHVG